MQIRTLCVVSTAVLTMAGVGIGDTHWQVQAVNSAGAATYYKVGAMPTEDNLIVLEGVLLNNPEDMLDPTYNAPGFMVHNGRSSSRARAATMPARRPGWVRSTA